MTVQQYSCETGQAGYWQLSESTRKSNFLQMLLLILQRLPFLLSYLIKNLSVGSAEV